MKKKTKQTIFVTLIIAIAVLDGFKEPIAAIPVVGAIATTVSNTIFEVIQVILTLGLANTARK